MMTYRYCHEGSSGGYPLEWIPEPEPDVICELCFDKCTDNFKVVDITASLSIIVCPACFNQDPVEFESMLTYIKNKKH